MPEKKKRTRRSKGAAPPVAQESGSGLAKVEGIELAPVEVNGVVHWLWRWRMPLESLCLLEGRKGTGKSSLCAAVAACVTGGPQIPEGRVAPKAPVLWCGSEESWEHVIIPRLVRHGADLSLLARPRLKSHTGSPIRLTLPTHLPTLRAMLREAGIKLLVLDPFSSLADPTIDLRHEQSARDYLEPLAEVLWEVGCTAILTRHLRKGTNGEAIDQGLGSVAVANACRSVCRADRHPVEDGLYVLSVVASNLGPRPPSLIYQLSATSEGCVVKWVGESALNADVLAEGRMGAADRDESRDARSVLTLLLSEGKRLASSVIAEARSCGIGERSIRRAKAELNCPSERQSQGANGEGQWYWCPPPDGFSFDP